MIIVKYLHVLTHSRIIFNFNCNILNVLDVLKGKTKIIPICEDLIITILPVQLWVYLDSFGLLYVYVRQSKSKLRMCVPYEFSAFLFDSVNIERVCSFLHYLSLHYLIWLFKKVRNWISNEQYDRVNDEKNGNEEFKIFRNWFYCISLK